MTTTFADHLPHRLTGLLVSAVVLLSALVTGAATAPPARASTTETAFVARVNHARASHGLPRLTVRGDLVAVARQQAHRMASRGVLYHNPHLTSDVKNWRWVGENVGYGPGAAALHGAFMRSAAHRANILDQDYTQIGIGAVRRGGRLWIAEVFRQPMHRATGWTHTLRRGSTGADVRRVQHRLGVRVTGFYGQATQHAVGHFQRRQGWRARGTVGQRTWARLF